ncbi:Bifunctional glutamate/proline--tRNA ligase [Porphyridium purpureum]|uniref:glutamate--tRNA ligase n=1 Tax=Porphyridium purpureum TaxID=35688 RepID=A0A5J4Z5T2_PORPP|nr:Bifunctional glutamate/proline--tRNA ligase [Porphyridium purpureum]|eukprot:POR5956..scf295_1
MEVRVGPQCLCTRAVYRMLNLTATHCALVQEKQGSGDGGAERAGRVVCSYPSGQSLTEPHVATSADKTAPKSRIDMSDAAAAMMLWHGGRMPGCKLLDASQMILCAEWMNTIARLPAEELLKTVNLHLVLRTFVLGEMFSVADVAIWAHFVQNPRAADALRLCLEERNPATRFFRRWWKYLTSLDVLKVAQQAAQSTVTGDWDEVMRLAKSAGSFDLDFPGLEPGKVVTRFPPEPSGYLHIGHAKAALMNDFLARYYGGKLIIRFDDTNPMKEKLEYEQSILEDLGRLGVRPDVMEYTSDYFETLLEFAKRFILEGKAYVDMTPVEQVREMRMKREESEFRSQSVEKNLELWDEMLSATETGQKCVLRAKIDMKNNNGAMRDPILYRFVLDPPHHRTGTKYKMYPSYDFSCPIVDSLEGVTHALRSAEYSDREEQYYWMAKAAGLRVPHMWDFARLNFQYTVMSKRKLLWFVTQGYVEGWNDPRFPTVQGIRRRGLTVTALRAFILSQGASKASSLMEWDKIWAINKKVIDPIAPRHTAIDAANHVRAVVQNFGDAEEVVSAPKHKKNPDVGMKLVIRSKALILEKEDAASVKVGEIVTLMDWGNMRVEHVDEADGSLKLEFLPDNADFKKTKKFTWLSAHRPNELVPVLLVKFDHLVTKAKIEEEDDIEKIRNPNSRVETPALADVNVRGLQKGDIIQMERRGFFICDSVPFSDAAKERMITLFEIPDGRGAR